MNSYDVVIIGSGISALIAALNISEKYSVCIISKLYPIRSHSVAAQGGINASFNLNGDSIEKHIEDTILASSYLADRKAVEYLCKNAKEEIESLEKIGVVFSRTENQKIAQRTFGGQSFPRTCYAKDQTGHNILYALYVKTLAKNNITFYNESIVTKLINIENSSLKSVVFYNLQDGKIDCIEGKAIIFATGGAGFLYKITSNSIHNTGDGLAIAINSGLYLKDMEFVQFHPTGLYPRGTLITEGVRGHGAHLINQNGERFMGKYSSAKELASRDVVSLAIFNEMNLEKSKERYVYLDLRHLDEKEISEKIPHIVTICEDFGDGNPFKIKIKIAPTAHYTMGGIHVNTNCEAIDENGKKFDSIYAIGECACVSVHGANRLGGNSLLETVVFGKKSAKSISKYLEDFEDKNLHIYEFKEKNLIEFTKEEERIKQILNFDGKYKICDIQDDLKNIMSKYVGIVKDENSLNIARDKILKLQEKLTKIKIHSKDLIFNTELFDYIQLENMLQTSLTIIESSLFRKESRGSFQRLDYPKSKETFKLHTLIRKKENIFKYELSKYNLD